MPSGKAKTLITLSFIPLGTLTGSTVSAGMLYLHYPEETFHLSEFIKNSLGAFIYSPFAMSLGVFTTFGFYGMVHGLIIVLGVLTALAGLIGFPVTGKKIFAALVFLGFAMWAHNNYLAITGLMSV